VNYFEGLNQEWFAEFYRIKKPTSGVLEVAKLLCHFFDLFRDKSA